MDSRILNWYMNYCCRDDYGATTDQTSAWAGIHYFASREPEEKGPLTWPEGNGWIVRRLLERVGNFVRTGQMVHRIVAKRSAAQRVRRRHGISGRVRDLRSAHVSLRRI